MLLLLLLSLLFREQIQNDATEIKQDRSTHKHFVFSRCFYGNPMNRLL